MSNKKNKPSTQFKTRATPHETISITPTRLLRDKYRRSYDTACATWRRRPDDAPKAHETTTHRADVCAPQCYARLVATTTNEFQYNAITTINKQLLENDRQPIQNDEL
jgi:hypothetical protein